MSILIDLVSYGTGVCSAFALSAFKRQKIPSNSVKWLWTKDAHNRFGYKCPVCIMTYRNNIQPKICECQEYHREHFHFKCADCDYSVLMRTANDPVDRKLWKIW